LSLSPSLSLSLSLSVLPISFRDLVFCFEIAKLLQLSRSAKHRLNRGSERGDYVFETRRRRKTREKRACDILYILCTDKFASEIALLHTRVLMIIHITSYVIACVFSYRRRAIIKYGVMRIYLYII